MKVFHLICFVFLIYIVVDAWAQTTKTTTNVTTTAKPRRTCACEDSEEPVCASNGITYKNSCRFDCAKAKVNRLRMVKRGKCGSATVGQYWQNRNSKFDK